jgi:uncharacterized protein DUF5666
MKSTLSIVAAAATLAASGAVATAGAAPTSAVSAATRHVEGRVVAVDRPARTFTVRDVERGTLKVKVTASARFQRLSGFSAVRTGLRVDVRAKRIAGAWRATKVEPAGARVLRNGADDPAGHDAGDDHGGRRGGHGADDPAGHR